MRRSFSFTLTVLIAALTLPLATARAQQMEILNFTADYCGPCQQIKSEINRLIASGAPIRTVDVTRNRPLAERFAVTHLPTFILVADGRELNRHVGGQMHVVQGMLARAKSASPQPAPVVRGQTPFSRQTPRQHAVSASTSPLGSIASDAMLIGISVRLRVEDGQGISYGTGTIIDATAGQAIVLTCGHLFRESQGRGAVQAELFELRGASPAVLQVAQGTVLEYDLTSDLGLVRLQLTQPVAAAPLAPEGLQLSPGQPSASVGCDMGKLPTVWRTRLNSINRYQGAANVQAARSPVQGRSGGGLFNEAGELIGVCFAADEEGDEGLYVGLPAIYQMLKKVGITPSASSPQSTPQADMAALTHPPQAPAVGMASATAPPQSRPLAAVPPPAAAATSSAPLSSQEQATLQEITRRGAGGEVIVIVRPAQPGQRSEIFSLENPSQEFVQQLTSSAQRATHPRFTSHDATVPDSSSAGRSNTSPKRPAASKAPHRGVAGWHSARD